MCAVHIANGSLRSFLLKHYDADSDGILSEADLAGVTVLEMTTPCDRRLLDDERLSVMLPGFGDTDGDLAKLTSLRALVLAGLPMESLVLDQTTIEEVMVHNCPNLRSIRIKGETFEPKETTEFYWRKNGRK